MPYIARRLALSPIVAACALLVSVPSQAITFEMLSADGSGSGTFYNPLSSDWVMGPNAKETTLTQVGNAWQIDVGTANFGSAESGQQSSDVFGAGVILPGSSYGWRVSFDANLRTWDSYNDGSVVQPNSGGSLGDWDLFSVNANKADFYWNLVSGSSGNGGGGGGIEVPTFMAAAVSDVGGSAGSGLIDPLVPVRPAGSVVSYSNTLNDPSYLPGNTWAWGGRDYAAGYFESVHTQGSILVGAGGPQYVSFVLDSRTPANNDMNYPSWGRFGVVGANGDDVPGGSTGQGPGGSIANPILPVGTSEDGTYQFSPIYVSDSGLDNYIYIDPEVAIGYEFSVAGGSKFKKIVLPTLGDANGYTIEVQDENGNWVSIGNVADGGEFTFTEDATVFRIVGIDEALGLDPANTVAFITGVKLDGSGTATFSMKPLTSASAVPEASSLAMLGAGLLMAGWARRRRAA
jgi:hypothetical protein